MAVKAETTEEGRVADTTGRLPEDFADLAFKYYERCVSGNKSGAQDVLSKIAQASTWSFAAEISLATHLFVQGEEEINTP